MRMLVALTLPMIVSGCFGAGTAPVESPPLCAGTADLRTRHAAALAEDGGPDSLSTGRALIATLDAGCADE